MPLIFSYGTLQQESVQRSTFGRRLEGHADALPGFEPSLVRIEDAHAVAASGKTHHANVTFNGRNESRVSGTVFEITDDELAAADRYEQLADYKRIAVTLASGKQAWVYVDEKSATRSRVVVEEQPYWFPAKRYGWGWGPPRAWQGWAVLAAFAILLLVGAVVLLPQRGPVTFVAYVALLCALLVTVCWIKGERPRWRWGGK